MTRSRIAAITLAFTIASATWLDATTLLAIKHGERIVVAADGAESHGFSASTRVSQTACKIRVGRRVAIAAGGLTRMTDTYTRKIVYDFHVIAQRVVGKANDVTEAVKLLRSELANVHAVMPYAVKINSPDVYKTLLTRSANGVDQGTLGIFLLAGLEGALVTMASVTLDFEAPTAESPFEHMRTWRGITFCPIRCPTDGVPFVLGMRKGIDAAMPHVRMSVGNDLVSQASHLLQEQTAVSHGLVGPPFAMVEVTKKGIAWLRQPDVCR